MSEANAIALLREQHEAMADVMTLRRLSSTPEQREKAESAIAVWRKVSAFLGSQDRRPTPEQEALRKIHRFALAAEGAGYDLILSVTDPIVNGNGHGQDNS